MVVIIFASAMSKCHSSEHEWGVLEGLAGLGSETEESKRKNWNRISRVVCIPACLRVCLRVCMYWGKRRGERWQGARKETQPF